MSNQTPSSETELAITKLGYGRTPNYQESPPGNELEVTIGGQIYPLQYNGKVGSYNSIGSIPLSPNCLTISWKITEEMNGPIEVYAKQSESGKFMLYQNGQAIEMQPVSSEPGLDITFSYAGGIVIIGTADNTTED